MPRRRRSSKTVCVGSLSTAINAEKWDMQHSPGWHATRLLEPGGRRIHSHACPARGDRVDVTHDDLWHRADETAQGTRSVPGTDHRSLRGREFVRGAAVPPRWGAGSRIFRCAKFRDDRWCKVCAFNIHQRVISERASCRRHAFSMTRIPDPGPSKTAHLEWEQRYSPNLSSSGLSRGSIDQQAPEFVARWIPATPAFAGPGKCGVTVEIGTAVRSSQ
jgi:hypothetical protein